MKTAGVYSLGFTPTRGASETAMFVAEQAERGRQLLQGALSIGSAQSGLFEELYTIAEEYRQQNWDGYGAEPVSEEAYKYAYRFLEALPLGTPTPTLGAEPDGQLTVEWHQSSRRTLSVSVSAVGELHYSALLPGERKVYGTEPFFGDVPRRILDLVNEVTT